MACWHTHHLLQAARKLLFPNLAWVQEAQAWVCCKDTEKAASGAVPIHTSMQAQTDWATVSIKEEEKLAITQVRFFLKEIYA